MRAARRIRLLAIVGMATAALALAAAPGVGAETLGEAFASAYDGNPRINAERARLRATDEELARAQSGYRPTLTGTASIEAKRTFVEPREEPTAAELAARTEFPGPITHPKTVGLNLAQPIFDGYRTVNAVREADATILAGRQTLSGIEQFVFLEVVTAYANVIRDQATLTLREANVAVLSRELQATEERFAVGEVTKTDVAQARARRAGAVSAAELAKANVRSSIADYVRVVGHPPTSLTEPRPLDRLLPAAMEDAIAIGMSENPDVVAAAFREKASTHTIDKIEGEMLPDIRVEASYQNTIDPNASIDHTQTGSVIARLTVPFYQGGEVAARVRQAKEARLGRLEDIESARVEVRAAVTSGWAQYVAARAQLESANIQVAATQVALEGVREEERVGQRTLLDVLDAQQELIDAKVGLLAAKRDVVVASYTIVRAMGHLTAADVGVGVELYDAEAHYNDTNGKAWGATIEREEGYEGYVIAPDQAE